MIQGVQCPAKRRGKPCHMAHAIEEVNPRKCNREEGNEGCRCKDRNYPFVCQLIHEGETREMYSDRVGFDPEHIKYDNYNYKELESEYNDCGKVVDELGEKIFGKFDLSNIPEKDKAYVRRTQNSIHHLCLKRKWLLKNMKERELEENAVKRKNEAVDRAAVDVRKMKEEALLADAVKSIDEAHAELVRKERYKEKRDKWYYGED